MKMLKKYICMVGIFLGILVFTSFNIYANSDISIYEEEDKLENYEPTISVQSDTYNSLKICIEEIEKASDYKIYRKMDLKGEFKLIATTSNLTYVDKGLTCGKTYYYKVCAINKKNNSTSKFSKIKGAKVIPSTVITKTQKSKTYNSVYISWNKVSGITGYRVYRSTSKNGKYVRVATTNKTSFTDKYLKNNKTYYYKVRAYRVVNGQKVFGAYSSVFSVKTKLAKPSVKINQAGDHVNINMGKASGATGYIIYRAKEVKGNYTKIAKTTKLKYTDKNIEFTKDYYYKVRAYKATYYKTYYSDYTSPTKITTYVPRPTITLERTDSKSLKVTWKKLNNSSGYELYMSGDGTNYDLIKNVTKWSTESYTKTGLSIGQKYYFKARTYKIINGQKKYSAYSNVLNYALNEYHEVLKLKSNYNVRSSTTSNYKSLGEIGKGQIVVAFDKTGNYYKIKFNGKTGYVHKNYANIYNDAKVIGLSNINQFSYLGGKALPMGCEVTSLAVVLQYLGFSNVTKNILADKFLPMGKVGSTDPNVAFVGTPYSDKPYGCYAPVIVKVANDYLKSVNNNSYNVNNLTGMDITNLYKEIDKGNPLVMWITVGNPFIQEKFNLKYNTKTTKEGNEIYTFTWYGIQHCVALAGYNKKNGNLIIADVGHPGGLREYTISSLKNGYNKLGKQVVSITKK